MIRTAAISECGTYRWVLTRVWNEKLPMLGYIGLNPSVADAYRDDQTIRKEIGFASRLGFGGIVKCNMYAFRATQPADLWSASKAGIPIIGAKNQESDIREHLKECTMVIAAWGRHGRGRQNVFVEGLRLSLYCFGKNSDSTPAHPLMLPYTTPLMNFWRTVNFKVIPAAESII